MLDRRNPRDCRSNFIGWPSSRGPVVSMSASSRRTAAGLDAPGVAAGRGIESEEGPNPIRLPYSANRRPVLGPVHDAIARVDYPPTWRS